jgi:hypothetical protein
MIECKPHIRLHNRELYFYISKHPQEINGCYGVGFKIL